MMYPDKKTCSKFIQTRHAYRSHADYKSDPRYMRILVTVNWYPKTRTEGMSTLENMMQREEELTNLMLFDDPNFKGRVPDACATCCT